MSDQSKTPQMPIAITGMACIYPGARNLEGFWNNIVQGVDAITDAPPHRIDPAYYDRSSSDADRLYCHRGGFIDEGAMFDPLEFGIMPILADAAEPDVLLSLKVAADALKDGGYEPGLARTKNVGVVIGRGGYTSPGMMRMIQRVRTPEQVDRVLRTILPHVDDDQLSAIRAALASSVTDLNPDTAIGFVPNLAASLIANRLDLHGPAYTVDAACASSLIAVDNACRELASNRCDLAIAGGVHLANGEGFWSVFCQLGAMSRSEQIRPFHRDADGLLVGEGVGLMLLKRLDDALRDDDRIYAVIRGVGVASDGKAATLIHPDTQGQVSAMVAAWRASALDPLDVGLVEAHGTATPAGDEVELSSLEQFFGAPPTSRPRPGLGTVKSMIGHTMPAAGAAGLIKTALAIHHSVLPPSIHCEEPHPAVERTRFRVVQEAESWDDEKLLAGVSAFGFGGINAHVVLTGSKKKPARRKRTTAQPPRMLRLSTRAPSAMLEALEAFDSAGTQVCLRRGSTRLALLDPTSERIEKARTIVERGVRWPGRSGIWYSPDGLIESTSKLAFLFPGVDATETPDVADVAEYFDVEPPRPAVGARGLEKIGFDVIEINRFYDRLLRGLGLVPDLLAGHSIGEWSGMISNGMLPEGAVEDFLRDVGPGSLEVPDVTFAALGCGVERARPIVKAFPDIAVSHDNCPHQSIICGSSESIEVAVRRLREDGVLCQVLPFKSGFHSPHLAEYIAPHQNHFARLPINPGGETLWSATTCAPYPESTDEIRHLALEHLLRPVRFRELVERLYEAGARTFIQVGSGSLIGFVDDTLKGKPHLSLGTCPSRRSKEGGHGQLRRLLTSLWVEGDDRAEAALRQFDDSKEAPRPTSASTRPSRPRPLALGAPLLEVSDALALETYRKGRSPLDSGTSSNDPVLSELGALQREIQEATERVLDAYRQSRSLTAPVVSRRAPKALKINKTLNLQSSPALVDHCLITQPPGWPDVADRQPVVPMTMSLALMIDAARAAAPDYQVSRVEDVSASKWLAVEPSVDVTITVTPTSETVLHVAIEGFAEARVILAPELPKPPEAKTLELTQPRPCPIAVDRLYADHWLFHGPQYQGITRLGSFGEEGMTSTLTTPPGPGALLDNAGQVLGVWVIIAQELNQLAMPIHIDSIELFGPDPEPGDELECTLFVRELEDLIVVVDIELSSRGRLHCRVSGWKDRRFTTDREGWAIMREPGRKVISSIEPGGYVLFDDTCARVPSRDWHQRRYLTTAEYGHMKGLGPRRARAWFNGRVAGKDAVRLALWKESDRPIYPVEVGIRNYDSGAPDVVLPSGERLNISLAHCGSVAVALTTKAGLPGIDIEKIERRSDDFEELVFSESERALLPQTERESWVTRFWCAKEALAKSRRTGLGGNPRQFTVQEVAGEHLLVDGIWIQTTLYRGFIIAWLIGGEEL